MQRIVSEDSAGLASTPSPLSTEQTRMTSNRKQLFGAVQREEASNS